MLRELFRRRGSTSALLPPGLGLEWSDGNTVEADNGEALHGRGFFFCDDDGEAYAWESRVLRETFGVYVFKIAGVSYRPDAMRHRNFDVGQVISLVPEPTNVHDRDAIAVYDAHRRIQVGYVPRDRTGRIRACLQAHPDAAAVVFHEWRLAGGERCALRALAAPASVVAAVAKSVPSLP